jgi:hypothetical protein
VKIEPRKRGRPPKNKAQGNIERYLEEAKVQPTSSSRKGPPPPGGLGKGSLPGGFMTD